MDSIADPPEYEYPVHLVDDPGTPLPIFGMILATAFAAFCLWLVVRIVNRRERWAKWLGAAVIAWLLIGYPLSIGPATWLYYHAVPMRFIPAAAASKNFIYWPIMEARSHGWFVHQIDWYLTLWGDSPPP
jgi:hypothetical protein